LCTALYFNQKRSIKNIGIDLQVYPRSAFMRIIKRYKNRRLYDTQEKKTIKLEGIAELVRKDVEFKVIDNATKKDITFSTLGQVLSQEMKDWKNSAKIIKELILTGGEATVDIFKKTLLAGLGLFDLTKEGLCSKGASERAR
jgi:polyhydroxyalkanoate synthesis repressor PhaR